MSPEAVAARSLRVLLALPRPLVTLLGEEEGEWVSVTRWDEGEGMQVVPQLHRMWKIEAVESALQVSGAPMAVRVLYHPTHANLRCALEDCDGYDVIILDAHGDGDGTLYLEASHGESHPLPADDLGRLLSMGGVKLAILSACYSSKACKAIHDAGVLAVVGMAETVREDAARAYLDAFLGRLARGHTLLAAHERGRSVLLRRWEARLGEDELPRLLAPEDVCQQPLVGPAQGRYRRMQDSPVGPRPPALTVRMRGRALDQVLVQRLLLQPPAEDGPAGVGLLVTMHGFGGVGKTTLAHAVAYWCWERALFPGGVYLARLDNSPVGCDDRLLDCLQHALGVALPDGERVDYAARVAAVCDVLGSADCLLVLDNFEVCHDQGDLALVDELRQRCTGLHILIVSRRAPLGFAGERLHHLGPLARDAAVALFRDRALEANKMLLHAERSIVAEICDLLGRVPLHIRMVATHMRAGRSPTAILQGLQDQARQHQLPVPGVDLADRVSHGRSQALALRYTYDHLDAHAQKLWAVMAGVFIDEPGRADVRAVYAHFEADRALDALQLWSVVESVEGQHRMAPAVRAFGRARLEEGVLGAEEDDFRTRYESVCSQRITD